MAKAKAGECSRCEVSDYCLRGINDGLRAREDVTNSSPMPAASNGRAARSALFLSMSKSKNLSIVFTGLGFDGVEPTDVRHGDMSVGRIAGGGVVKRAACVRPAAELDDDSTEPANRIVDFFFPCADDKLHVPKRRTFLLLPDNPRKKPCNRMVHRIQGHRWELCREFPHERHCVDPGSTPGRRASFMFQQPAPIHCRGGGQRPCRSEKRPGSHRNTRSIDRRHSKH